MVWFLVLCVAIATAQVLLSPYAAPYWWPRSVIRLSDGVIFQMWGALTVAWIVVVLTGVIMCGRRALWLLLTAPFGLLPVTLIFMIYYACIVNGQCL